MAAAVAVAVVVVGGVLGEGLRRGVVGDLGGALAKYQEALAMRRRVHGEDAKHHHIADTLAHLGDVAAAQNDSAGALTRYQEALAMYREVFEDEEHPKVKETAEKTEALRSRSAP